MSSINGLPFPFDTDPAAGAEQIEALARAVAERLEGVLPGAGSIALTARTFAPDGWMICDGRVVSRTEWPDLFEAIGISFGAGDRATTFQIPDLRNASVRIDPTEVGHYIGSDVHTLTVSQMPAHAHGVSDPGHETPSSSPFTHHLARVPVVQRAEGPEDIRSVNTGGATVTTNQAPGVPRVGWYSHQLIHGHPRAHTGISIQNTGSGQPHNNVPRSLNLNAMISTGRQVFE